MNLKFGSDVGIDRPSICAKFHQKATPIFFGFGHRGLEPKIVTSLAWNFGQIFRSLLQTFWQRSYLDSFSVHNTKHVLGLQCHFKSTVRAPRNGPLEVLPRWNNSTFQYILRVSDSKSIPNGPHFKITSDGRSKNIHFRLPVTPKWDGQISKYLENPFISLYKTSCEAQAHIFNGWHCGPISG